MDKKVEWSDLPKELWPLIAKHLNTTLDLLRFRSTCKSWRSAIPLPLPLPSSHSLFPPQTLIPLPSFSSHIYFPLLQTLIPLPQFSLRQTKIYRLEPSSSSSPHHHQLQDPSISSLSPKGWIIKVGESKSLPLPLLDPFTNFHLSHTHRSRYPSDASPKLLNLINFRFVQLIEAFFLCEPVLEVRKIVLFPGFPSQGRMVFALFNDGKLTISKIGDEDWAILDDGNLRYDDIILHKGQLYVVDKLGTIFWVDCSSFKLVQFSPMLCGFGKRKYLVESGGSLHVVDMYIEEKPENSMGMHFELFDPDNPMAMDMGMSYEVVDVKVYKLDEEWGKWLDVKSLGEVVFVLSKDCNFSVSAQDYYGCEGNCVYFYSEGRACAFSLDNSKFTSPNPFWPCPTLFHPKFNL